MPNEEVKQIDRERFNAWSKYHSAKHIGAFAALLCGWAAHRVLGDWFSIAPAAAAAYLLVTYKYKQATIAADHKYEMFHGKRGV
jgi:hypothetical protein